MENGSSKRHSSSSSAASSSLKDLSSSTKKGVMNAGEEAERLKASGYVGLTDKVSDIFDSDIYYSDKNEYVHHISADADNEYEESNSNSQTVSKNNSTLNISNNKVSQIHQYQHVHAQSSADVLKLGSSNNEDDDEYQNNSAASKRAVLSREDEYRRQRLNRMLSPERADPFGNETPGPDVRSYRDVMIEQQLDKEKAEVIKLIRKKQDEEKTDVLTNSSSKNKLAANGSVDIEKSKIGEEKKKRRWDMNDEVSKKTKNLSTDVNKINLLKNEDDLSRWDTPSHGGGGLLNNEEPPTPNIWEDTPVRNSTNNLADTPLSAGDGVTKKNRWEASNANKHDIFGDTPTPQHWGETPALSSVHTGIIPPASTGNVRTSGKKKSSRWDATPIDSTPISMGGIATPLGNSTPGMTPTPFNVSQSNATPSYTPTPGGPTPLGMTGVNLATPITPSAVNMGADDLLKMRIQSEVDERNRYLSDEELNLMIPTEGYEVVAPPADYNPPIRRSTPSTITGGGMKATATPTPLSATPLYSMPDTPLVGSGIGGLGAAAGAKLIYEVGGGVTDLGDLEIKAEDYQYFSKLFQPLADEDDGADMTREELNERKVLTLLLKIKNGTPPIRRTALRIITEKAKEFGAGALFSQILPLMMLSTLEDQERHLLVKVIDRVLYKLDEDVRPYVHKILVVIEPLLIDEDYYARVEGREIISNLSKAAGLATMIATMRPDIDHQDEYVRNTTARAFAVVASALGIPSLILFLKAVCQSKKSWQARHTGIKIIQQIAILMGCGVVPHLRQLVEIIAHGLQDEQTKVRTITALALAALAEASTPYGIEAFDCVLRNLWKGITEHRGKNLAAFLKAIGLIIPLMDPHHANYYTREVMIILINEFSTPDEEMKKIVLKVVKQCVSTEGVEAEYIRTEVLPHFFNKFWVVRNAFDRRNAKQLVETTVELANKVGCADILNRIVDDLKDPSEAYRKMVLECIESIITNMGVIDISVKLEEQLIDGILYAFQEQATEDTTLMLNAFACVVNALNVRIKPYLPQIAGIIRWRLNTPSAKVRQQAADLIARIAVVMKKCDEEQMLGHLGLFLYEYLGEEYPEVLGSILGALKAIVNVIGMQKMTPPIKDLLPRLTPIMKNRHEKVQENVIDLIGRIADRGGDLVSPKEWDRICFDLLELLKAHKKNIRRATVNTFGYIARAIGPHDVLNTLLNNLKVQERQLRVCTTVAIAIVAETCLPYTVLPALMNEYKVQELNVQNGVLKALSFMFEYIGEMSKDYIYAVTPLLEDALMDRDLVHRQTAAWACKHLALGVHGLGCEDALQHLFNFVWPNIFESSPHLMQSVLDAIDGFRVSLGAAIILQYLLHGLFHPSRKVREVYWRIYNNVYIGHQDALVPVFPAIEDDYKNRNIYTRHELYLLI